MSVLWSSSLLKKLVNANSSKEWEASGIEIDSRKVKKGDLFCALNGENYNGHDFIYSASDRGAVACLISENLINNKKISGIISEIHSVGKNTIIITGFGINIISSPKIDDYLTTNINEYKKNILDEDSLIVTIEAGETSNWKKYLRANGISFGIDRFGESAPFKEIFNSLNLSEDKIVSEIQNRLRSQ